jgi:hypothetical protein
MTKYRIEVLDYLRGLAIIDMMFVHYRQYINILPGFSVDKIISYTDFAIEGFIFLFGVMIGTYYYPKYIIDKKLVIRRILLRVFQIIKIQYLLILTISLPMAVIIGKEYTRGETVKVFIAKSLILINQVNLLHILPTFIPLLLLSIPTLYIINKGYDYYVLATSLLLFAIGNMDPYLFTFGEKTIFPVILWQIYYTLGLLLGKKLYKKNNIINVNITRHIMIAFIIFILSAFAYHGHHLYPEIAAWRSKYHIVVSKFPLNYLGFLYYGSILYLIYSITFMGWKYIKQLKCIYTVICVFGKNSLRAFIIHVYFAYLLVLINYFIKTSSAISVAVVVMNFVVTFIILRFHEKRGLRQLLA